MSEKVDTVRAWLDAQIGCPYIYGATGQACTPRYRRARITQYPQYTDMIIRNCPRLKGTASSCAGCKWARDGVGRLAYDCAQLARRAMEQAGIYLVSGANSQWEKTAFVKKGEIRDMPYGMMCLVYRDDGGKMGHTGLYDGSGYVEHAKGHDYGVVRERWQDTRFSHFGIPAGLYTDDELRAAGIDPSGNIPTLRRGSKGELVKSLQEYLNDETGAGLTVDGVFGAKTETAVKYFQSKHGLTADGVVGPKTWAAMGGAPDKDEMPEEPADAEKPEQDEGGETVAVPKAMLEALADTLEDMALDIRGYCGYDPARAHAGRT